MRRISLRFLMDSFLTAVCTICKLNVKMYSFHSPSKLAHCAKVRRLMKYVLNVCVHVGKENKLRNKICFYYKNV